MPSEAQKPFLAYFTSASSASKIDKDMQIECGDLLEKSASSHYKDWLKTCSQRDRLAYKLKLLLDENENKHLLKKKSLIEITLQAKEHEKNRSWRDLPLEQQKPFASYFSFVAKSLKIEAELKTECGGGLENAMLSPHYKEWKSVCYQRDRLAYKLQPLLETQENKYQIKSGALYYIGVQAKNYEEVAQIQAKKSLPAKSSTKELFQEKFVQPLDRKQTSTSTLIKETSESKPSYSSWQKLTRQEENLCKNYFQKAEKASELNALVQAESAEKGLATKNTSYYQSWQTACGERNKAAYALTPILAKEEARDSFQKGSLYYIESHAKKYEAFLQAGEKIKQAEKLQDLHEDLKNQIEPLLTKLFPDGPSQKTATQYRFGTKGSLSITHSGSKTGQFYDFETSEGGGLLKLIQKELHLSSQEAKSWASEFLGNSSSMHVSPLLAKPKKAISQEEHWVSLKPPSHIQEPSARKIGEFIETARYPYKNTQGELLYYVVRLEDKKGNKITPPLSYGYDKQKNTPPYWKFKGFDFKEEKRPLYHLDHLQKNPFSRVLLVEGEKTADRALEKFPDRDFICMTWSGGAASVSKADWSPLTGREVIVWPDNDKAGFQAASEVCDELKKVCASKVCMVDRPELFEKLPSKWDLADPLPEGISNSSLSFQLMDNRKDLLQYKVFRAIGLYKASLAEKQKAAYLLLHFEKTHKEKVDAAFNQEMSLSQKDDLWDMYTKGGVDFLMQREEIYERVTSDPTIHAHGKLATYLTDQLHLQTAKKGFPREQEILLMKETIQAQIKEADFLKDHPADEKSKDFSIFKALEDICGKSLQKKEVYEPEKKDEFKKEVESNLQDLTQQEKQEKIMQEKLTQQEQQKSLEKGFSYDPCL